MTCPDCEAWFKAVVANIVFVFVDLKDLLVVAYVMTSWPVLTTELEEGFDKTSIGKASVSLYGVHNNMPSSSEASKTATVLIVDIVVHSMGYLENQFNRLLKRWF